MILYRRNIPHVMRSRMLFVLFLICVLMRYFFFCEIPQVAQDMEVSGQDMERSGQDMEGSGQDMEGSGQDMEGRGQVMERSG